MKTHSISKSSKKLMAILCAVMMLASCMVFAPASAVTAQDYYYQFAGTNKWNVDETSYQTSYWNQPSNAPVNLDAGKGSAKIVEAADNPTGSGYAMEMSYGANLAATTNNQYYSVFSLPNTTGATRDGRSTGQTIHLLQGITYKITVQYKVVNFVSEANLYVAIAMGNLKDGAKTLPSNNAVLANITEAAEGWVTSTGYFTNAEKQGAYIVLGMVDDTNRAGTNVQVGSITIEPVDLTSYTMDPNYDGASADTVDAVAGQKIADKVSTPSRTGGYTFLGWFDAPEGGNQVTEFPAESATLYAHWDTPDVPLYTVTFDGKGGTVVGDKSAEYAADETITQTATRPGYSFLGWKNAAGETVTAAPADDVTLYADWEKTGTVAEIDGLQSFETATADELVYNTNRVPELVAGESHTFAGDKALKSHIQAGMNGQLARPRLLIGEVEAGKSYTVSFWAKTTEAIAEDFNFYLATYKKDTLETKISTEGPWYSGINPDTHTLQALTMITAPAGAKLNDDSGIKGAALWGTLPTEWTQYTVSFTATADKESAENCLVLGYTDNGSWKTGYVARDIYIDDIQVVETATLAATHNYEAKPLGSYGSNHGAANQLAGTGNGRTVTDEVMNHSFGLGGIGHTAKVTLEGQAINEPRNCYTALYNADATILQIKPGSSYLVSAWLYSATDATVGVYLRTANNAATWLGSPSVEVAKKTVDLQANTWTQVHLQGTIPTDGDYNVIALGFANTVADATKAVYVDDTSVLCADSALGKVNGNVGVYKNGESSYYEQDGVKYGALRLLGGYTIADGDATKAVIGGNTYTVKARGILLGKDEQTTLTVDGECYYKSEKTTNLDGYWLMEGNVLKYSLLVNKISADKIGTNVHYRPYIIVTDGTAEYTLYGDTVLNVNWSAVAESAGVDTGWTAE